MDHALSVRPESFDRYDRLRLKLVEELLGPSAHLASRLRRGNDGGPDVVSHRHIQAANADARRLTGRSNWPGVVWFADEDRSGPEALDDGPGEHGRADRPVVLPVGDQLSGAGTGVDQNDVTRADAVEQSACRAKSQRLTASLSARGLVKRRDLAVGETWVAHLDSDQPVDVFDDRGHRRGARRLYHSDRRSHETLPIQHKINDRNAGCDNHRVSWKCASNILFVGL